ncbi:hypothetical protein AUR64_02910 [Haloprofundus marisrubri]|uniref:Uncharacterized protein n=1 Tax=Haloprofundus marisrubri TaxID=1514971 RepID=A0A0W1R2T2_9EURY|nr:hypothetical protein AUR64_02910 [Haloprofundus marisrubri]
MDTRPLASTVNFHEWCSAEYDMRGATSYRSLSNRYRAVLSLVDSTAGDDAVSDSLSVSNEIPVSDRYRVNVLHSSSVRPS